MSAESNPPPFNWRWIDPTVINAVHDRQLAEHGGSEGIRDAGGIESALARPVNLANYGEPDAPDLAAAYAYGLAKNHGFVDGNKRTAWIAARLFLVDNGYRLSFDQLDAIRLMEGVAAGTVSEPELAAWFRERLTAPT
ncbi:MAG: type II toxin-antitoxin system death-on-curing family toxin [Alphaproteobacteria bacterium]|nr:type II toxin-antitoxin system death-on-curing family toxin [Alphaproteobacteria bacterium]MBN59143.1 type II toxin-antitoxin system death-on-curing family toxin [Oceanospirillaceae bacterium]MAJ64480.1 type II toxin-antitoxin system death-on-curing family toxin [Alphaproteobacteria bacterium]MAJ64512.1 type II toxin-antitoxin system death-on-curing family toxin [Alphaproteobacteria bacterium]MAS48266.1 type II toxin-antitoxin system death-on-curing family toxin [Alphaproteobacteria bacteriu